MDAGFTPKLIDDARSGKRKSYWLVPVTLFLASVACLPVDVPIAMAVDAKSHRLPKALDGWVREALENCEVFGHGVGVFLIVIAVGVLDPSRRKYLSWLFAGAWGSGLAANLIKGCIYRTRPRAFNFETGTVWNSFTGASGGRTDMQSFPSAHTATAVGLAMMLAYFYPRGRWFFYLLAALVGLQRVVSSAHFPSDVFMGATIGWFVATLCQSLLKLGHGSPQGNSRAASLDLQP